MYFIASRCPVSIYFIPHLYFSFVMWHISLLQMLFIHWECQNVPSADLSLIHVFHTGKFNDTYFSSYNDKDALCNLQIELINLKESMIPHNVRYFHAMIHYIIDRTGCVSTRDWTRLGTYSRTPALRPR